MGSFLQSEQWAAFKAKYGWKPRRLDGTLVLARKILFGRSLLYAPETELVEEAKIRRLLEHLRSIAQEDRAFAFRLEIVQPYQDDITNTLQKLNFRKSFESVQPEWRAVVDIRPSEEEILSCMHQKGRYNIRVAERHGVKVVESQEIDQFYTLYLETAKREHFSPRGKQYFDDFLSMIPGSSLFLALNDSQPLAAAIVVFFEDRASYLYGASGSAERQLMAPYLLHWEIMREAKKRGAASYDLGEMPPADATDHPLKGLGEFKMKFGGELVRLTGSWDYVYQPWWYTLFRVGEKLRRGFRA